MSPDRLLEKSGVDRYAINYDKKIVRLDKKDMLKLIADWDDGFFIPVTVVKNGWMYTTGKGLA
jgi:hypothetical protein